MEITMVPDLENLLYEEGDGRYPPGIAKKFRMAYVKLRSAKNIRDVEAIGGFNFKGLKGDKSGTLSIRLNKQWRLEFTLDETTNLKILYLKRISNHYQ